MKIAAEQLRSYVERIERLREEARALSSDMSEVYKEAKGNGFDVKALKIVIQRRALDDETRDERDSVVDIYERALGMKVALRARAPEAADAV